MRRCFVLNLVAILAMAGGRAAAQPPVEARPETALPAGAVTVRPALTTVPRPAPARASRGRVQVPLEMEEGPAGQPPARPGPGSGDGIRVAAGDGRIVRAADGSTVLDLPADGLSIVSSGQARDSAGKSRIGADAKTTLPWLVIESRPALRGPLVRTARPFLTLARSIQWDGSARRHVAEFLFGLDAESGDPGPLRTPLDARFVVSCEDVAPDSVRVRAIGTSGYSRVRVTCSPATNKAEHFLGVHIDSGNLRYPFQIPRRPGPPVLTVSPTSVLGFGFGLTRVTVGHAEEDGTPLPADGDLKVNLTVEGGPLVTDSIVIGRGKTEAFVDAHPPGVGELRLVATVGGLKSSPVRIELLWPVWAVGATVIGGLIGGIASGLVPGRPRRWRRRIVEGTLVGLIVTLAVFLIPTLAAVAAWAVQTELGLFVLAGVAGFVGTPLLDRLARAIFPSLATADAAQQSPPKAA